MRIVAVCACTVGIAHTYMAKKALEDECKRRGIACKVEAQGGIGIENALTQAEIDAADVVIHAVDVDVNEAERFEAKEAEGRLLKVGTSETISTPAEIIDQALAAAEAASTAGAAPVRRPLFENFGKDLLAAFNTGVSYFIPIVVIGGVFLAFSLASGQAGEAGMEITNPFMQNLNLIGMAGINMMIPVLAAYIAYSIAGKPALAPGFVLGYLVNNPVPIGDVNVSTGFLGAMIMAVAVGYWVKWMKTWRTNDTIATIMPILIIPILTSLVLGMVYIYVLAAPLSVVMDWLTNALSGLSGGSAVVLGVVIGIMTAIDMGGPINKTASTFTMALMTTGVYAPNGMFRVAVAIPPIACGIAALVARNKYDAADRQMGISALFMGCIGITEGAIPFAVKDFARTAPAICIGSAVGAALAAIQGIECYVPHGGFIVAMATNNIALFCLDIVIGSLVGAAILIALKPKLETAVAE